mmetsp:Transcript_52504/g.152618  ORF Transcript_52504/g.152618 Transcript_52504/m.152618 type:complete len:217 (-) Transcript_52504:85-735(-)
MRLRLAAERQGGFRRHRPGQLLHVRRRQVPRGRGARDMALHRLHGDGRGLGLRGWREERGRPGRRLALRRPPCLLRAVLARAEGGGGGEARPRAAPRPGRPGRQRARGGRLSRTRRLAAGGRCGPGLGRAGRSLAVRGGGAHLHCPRGVQVRRPGAGRRRGVGALRRQPRGVPRRAGGRARSVGVWPRSVTGPCCGGQPPFVETEGGEEGPAEVLF